MQDWKKEAKKADCYVGRPLSADTLTEMYKMYKQHEKYYKTPVILFVIFQKLD